MTKLVTVIACVGIAASLAQADDQSFQKTKIPDAKGTQTPVGLLFSDSKQAIQVRSAGQVLTEVPYSSIDGLSYEHTQKHRITQGAVVMVASIGAGAVVMLTKSKSHFLTVNYHEETASKELVLRLDKSEYRDILATAKVQTGKDVAGKKENSNVEFQKH